GTLASSRWRQVDPRAEGENVRHAWARWILLSAVACTIVGAAASSAWGAGAFRPRVDNALGLTPPVNSQGNLIAQPTEEGVLTPPVYHGGPVMTGGVTVHTIFWAPSGYSFQGAPSGGMPTY